MQFKNLLLTTLLLTILVSQGLAQIVSGNAFLKGNYVEVGIGSCGTYGSTINAPAGYHPRGDGSFVNRLGFVADAAKDGWAAGTPNYCGDYFVPGSPEEGFGIQINGVNYNNNQLCSEVNISGSVTDYRITGPNIIGTWKGAVAGVEITSVTTVPLNDVFFISEVTLRNTTSATLNNIYFMRNVDPDNEVTLPGGVYTTNNFVVAQNPNVGSRALVSATGLSYGCYLGLGTLDCRARVAFGGFSNRNPSAVWNGTGGLSQSGSTTADIAIAIAFKINSLAAGESTTFRFAHVLAAADLERALNLTVPSLQVNGIPTPSGSTVNVCAGIPVPLQIINGSAYTFTWSPATGLNTATGPSVIATVNSTTTYTATGVDACGSNASLSVTLNPTATSVLGTIGAISGPTSVCLPAVNQTYSVSPVTNATLYEWTVPSGTSIVGGDGTNSIQVAFSGPVTGNITVRARNGCGITNTSAASLSISTTNAPVVSYNNVNATAPAGSTGVNVTYPAPVISSSLPINFTYAPASGSFFPIGTTTVNVTASNSCGSTSGSFTVTVTPSSTPVYYSKATGDLHNVLTWGLNPDGSGANPSDFNDSTFQLANRPSGLYTMTANWEVNGGTVNIPSGSQLQINGFTFSISELSGTGTISGSATSNLTVIGTNGGNIPLSFTAASNTLNNLTVNRMGTDAAATLGNALNVLNAVTLTTGLLNTGGNLTLKSTASNTARVAPITATAAINGDVTVERYIPARRAWRILSAPVGGVTAAATGQATMTHSQETTRGMFTTSSGGSRPMSYGTMTFSLNAAQTALTMTATIYNIDVNGSQTPADANDNLTAAHIHVGAFIGANAGVRWGFFGAPDNDVAPDDLMVTPFASGVGGTFTTKWDLNEGNGGSTLTLSLADILKGLAYVNFHTSQFPGGEIRGQISMVGAGTQTINQAWQEGATTASPNPNPFPGYGTHITGGPMFGSTANGFDQNPGAESSIKMYNPNINNWEVLQNTNATSVGSDAYMTFIRGNRGIPIGQNSVPPNVTTLRAKGPLKVGDQFYPVSGNGFTAIGNPFASPINFATLTRVGVQNNFYLWDPKMGSQGAYVLLSDNGAGGYTIVPAPVSPESQYIQSGQGFLVRPTTAGTAGSVTIKESDKSATAATDVFRMAGGGSTPFNSPVFADPQSEQGLRVDLKAQSANGELVLLDETFASYKASHDDRLNDLDGVKMENINENLGIFRDGQTLMLERRQLPKEGDVIELKLWNTKPQAYVLELNPVRLAGTGLNAYVEDRYLKTVTPVSLEEKSQHQFSVTGNAASAQANRFVVVFKKATDAITLTGNSITPYPNPVQGSVINLAFANKAKGVYQVTLVNSTGQVVLRRNVQHAGGTATQPLQLDRKPAKGIYQLHVLGADGTTTVSITSN